MLKNAYLLLCYVAVFSGVGAAFYAAANAV